MILDAEGDYKCLLCGRTAAAPPQAYTRKPGGQQGRAYERKAYSKMKSL